MTYMFCIIVLSVSYLVPDASCTIEYKVTGDHKWINTNNSWYTLEATDFTSSTGNTRTKKNIDKSLKEAMIDVKRKFSFPDF